MPVRRVIYYQDEHGYTKEGKFGSMDELFNLLELFDNMHVPFHLTQGTTVLAQGNTPWRPAGQPKE